ncbi:MAG: glycosyltransferase [Thermodesulfobacteriota bacterium]
MELSIIIPAHNEEGNLPVLLERITSEAEHMGIEYEVIVVNDNSTDDTEKTLSQLKEKHKRLIVINRRSKRGVGNTLREGFKTAKGEIIITMDADMSHDPQDIPRLYNKATEGYDVVIGSRYVKGGGMDTTPGRLILSKGFALFSNILGLPLKDATTGYRAQRRDVIEALNLEATGFEIHVEIPMKAKRKGFKLCEVPIKYGRRKEGKSKLRYIEEGPRYIKIAIKSALGL